VTGLSAIQNYPASHYVALSGQKQGIDPGFPLNEGQIKILNGGFRLDVATTPGQKSRSAAAFISSGV
jgi:hypothetical protein